MKKVVRLAMLMLVTASILTVNGCKKAKDGEDGTDGTPGATGPQGAVGATGASGAANIVSHTYSIASWNSDADKWYTDLAVPELTPANINTAMVQTYLSVSTGNWIALPNTEVASTNYFMGFTSAAGTVEVNWVYNGFGIGSSPNSYYAVTCQFKVVVIPPALITAHPNVDLKNYNAVKNAFNLKD